LFRISGHPTLFSKAHPLSLEIVSIDETTAQIHDKGFRPVISARQGRMLGSRNPFDGPVFDTLQDAITFTIGVLADYFDRGLGLSDARLQLFKGMMS